MNKLILLSLVLGFVIISFSAYFTGMKIKNRGFIPVILLLYAIAIYYLLFAIHSWQNVLESRGEFVYIDHDGIINWLVEIALCGLALINAVVIVVKRF